MPKGNRLAQEKSPYLLQHKDNPVHWYPWGEAAFAAARSEDKPIFLSIGYSTCHWCHVMAHQSFQDQEVADFLNRHFIPIKVDREERPDVDEIYMSAVHAMGQRGGWPLSVFLTSDLKPFYGGTYWPKQSFLHLLRQLSQMWQTDRTKALGSAESLVEYLKEQKKSPPTAPGLGLDVLRRFFFLTEQSYDATWGGFGAAPKFPHAVQISMLLRIYRRTGVERALQMAIHSLEMMARGGLYDHVGGGFARYSVDERWHIPHFEKMLYDNALLTLTYLEAYQVCGIEMFRSVAVETLDYVLRDMTHEEGGFFSAQDADSEGEEGKFYLWTMKELEQALSPEEFERFKNVYSVTSEGNFEHGTNHFHLDFDFGWSEKQNPLIQSALQKLFTLREQRVHPHKDDKVLVSWNGLMIRAMAKAYQVTGEGKYLRAAQRAANFIGRNLFRDGKLLARYREGEARFAARLEDYAYLIQGLLDLYECDFSLPTLARAKQLQELQMQLFWDPSEGGFFNTDGSDPSLLLRTKEGMDGALPNPNGVAVLNLLRLEGLLFGPDYREKAERTFTCFARLFSEYPHAFSQMALAFDYFSEGGTELAVVSPKQPPDFNPWLPWLHQTFLPNGVFAWGEEGQTDPKLLEGRKAVGGATTYYLCREHTCESPRTAWEEIRQQLEKPGRYSLG